MPTRSSPARWLDTLSICEKVSELPSTSEPGPRIVGVLQPGFKLYLPTMMGPMPDPEVWIVNDRGYDAANRGGLIFQASNLDPLPLNKAYELWVIPANGKAPIPAGTFRPDATGSASLVLPPLPTGVPAKAFGVTVERAEGSETPTAPIILSGVASNAGE